DVAAVPRPRAGRRADRGLGRRRGDGHGVGGLPRGAAGPRAVVERASARPARAGRRDGDERALGRLRAGGARRALGALTAQSGRSVVVLRWSGAEVPSATWPNRAN